MIHVSVSSVAVRLTQTDNPEARIQEGQRDCIQNALSVLRSAITVSVCSVSCCLRGGAMNSEAFTLQVTQAPNMSQPHILLYNALLRGFIVIYSWVFVFVSMAAAAAHLLYCYMHSSCKNK